MVLLDLSAAFDTIDHQILLSKLSSFYGLSNTALNLIASNLLDRTQSVSIGTVAFQSSFQQNGHQTVRHWISIRFDRMSLDDIVWREIESR